jgi:hypothetical protein
MAKELQYPFKFVFKVYIFAFEISPINENEKIMTPQIGRTHDFAILGFFLEVSKKNID